MSVDPIRVAANIAAIKAHFIATNEYARLQTEFERLLQRRRAELLSGHSAEARGVVLIGPTGSGKSRCVERLLLSHRGLNSEISKKPDAEIISFIVPSPTTLKSVGETALRALGYPIQRNRTAAALWDLVRHHLKERRTLFLHLDEAQDLYSNQKANEMRAVVNTLKSLMQAREWPVGIILSGMPQLDDLLSFDTQLKRRMRPIRFAPVSEIEDADNVRGLLSGLGRKAGLAITPGLMSQRFIETLIKTADHRFGITIEVIVDSMEEALLEGSTSLRVSHFAAIHDKRMGKGSTRNHFMPLVTEEIVGGNHAS